VPVAGASQLAPMRVAGRKPQPNAHGWAYALVQSQPLVAAAVNTAMCFNFLL
jgi:hypothetical protein